MSALATRADEQLASRADLAGFQGYIAPSARASGFVVVAAEAECTCPHDCERDHPNE
jgi:hypothetical protein